MQVYLINSIWLLLPYNPHGGCKGVLRFSIKPWGKHLPVWLQKDASCSTSNCYFPCQLFDLQLYSIKYRKHFIYDRLFAKLIALSASAGKHVIPRLLHIAAAKVTACHFTFVYFLHSTSVLWSQQDVIAFIAVLTFNPALNFIAVIPLSNTSFSKQTAKHTEHHSWQNMADVSGKFAREQTQSTNTTWRILHKDCLLFRQ